MAEHEPRGPDPCQLFSWERTIVTAKGITPTPQTLKTAMPKPTIVNEDTLLRPTADFQPTGGFLIGKPVPSPYKIPQLRNRGKPSVFSGNSYETRACGWN